MPFIKRKHFGKKKILVRAGLHCLGEKNIEGMTVCPKHRHAFGKFWRPPTTCQYPQHAGKTTAIGGTHVINLKVAEEIRAIFGQTIPVGSRKYNLFLFGMLKNAQIYAISMSPLFLALSSRK